MKKTTKATIAAGAAVLLLLGSGGTLAYWNDTANLSGQNAIAAGTLALTATGTPTCQNAHTGGAATAVADIADVRLVPGDRLIYAFPTTITAQGQHLRFRVALAGGSIAPATAAPADAALATRLTGSATFAVSGLTPVGGTTDVFDHLSNTSGAYATTITATIEWPFGDAASPASDNPAKLGKVDLQDFTLTVTQLDASV
jgi:alternate signal-mediated exported protein